MSRVIKIEINDLKVDARTLGVGEVGDTVEDKDYSCNIPKSPNLQKHYNFELINLICLIKIYFCYFLSN